MWHWLWRLWRHYFPGDPEYWIAGSEAGPDGP